MSNQASKDEQELRELWEGMFGNSVTAKGGEYTVDYRDFMRRIEAQKQRWQIEARIEELYRIDPAGMIGDVINRIAHLKSQLPSSEQQS